MKDVKILDCTLRDGGYVNDFLFGKYSITKIISQLTTSGIDIIECGFLEDGEYNPECSVFNRVEQIKEFIPTDRKHSMYVAMACYGEYSIEQLSDYDGQSIDGIRVTFHYNEVEDAMKYCSQIQQKGYKVFVQPVGTTSYSDDKLLQLIHIVNSLKPYAFYLVDTLGLMNQYDVLRFFYLIDHNLDKTINIGFHSHNNLQLSFSNCQVLVNINCDRTIFLDASVNGMGRGAGNLNTELIANYLNDHFQYRYEIEPLLEIIDEFIGHIKKEHEWGYSVPYYLAAINGCHPNYASYLSSKQTLTVKHIATILKMIEPEKRSLFNKELAEKMYKSFQSQEIDDSEIISELRKKISGRNVILIAPGSSLNDYRDKIFQVMHTENCISISVTFVPNFMDCDYVFLSNLKRYDTTFNPQKKQISLIHTSNIKLDGVSSMVVNYSSLLCEPEVIMDNSCMMALNLLCKLSPSKIYLAGLDGYSLEKNNYCQDRLNIEQDKTHLIKINQAIRDKIKELISCKLSIEFVTPSLYQKVYCDGSL